MKQYVPISEFCRRCRFRLKPARVRHWCRAGYRGEKPPHCKVGGRYFIEAEAMDRWLRGDRSFMRPEKRHAAKLIRAIVVREDREHGGNTDVDGAGF